MLRHSLAIVAVLLLAAVLLLWQDSYRNYLNFSRGTPDSRLLLAAIDGRFRIARFARPDPPFVDTAGPRVRRLQLGKRPWPAGLQLLREPRVDRTDFTYWEAHFISDISGMDYCTYTRHPGGWITISGHILGFADGSDHEFEYPCHAVEASLAWPAALLAIPATLGILHFVSRFKRYRRHRRNPTLCPTCAYDLRAHAPGQQCPECGTVIAAQGGNPP